MNIDDISLLPNHMHRPIDDIRVFKDYKMFIIRQNDLVPIVFGDITWSDSVDTLGIQCDFSVPRNVQDIHLQRYDNFDVGDKILFMNGDVEIFRGMIVDIRYNRYSKDITAYDFGFLLGQNKIFKQFNKTNSENAIRELCRLYNIPILKLSGLTATITEIYQNTSVADIIKQIIEENEKINNTKYRMEIREGKLVIEPYSNLIIKPITKTALGQPTFDPTLLPGNISRTDSIKNIVNKVHVTSGDSKEPKIIYTQSNQNSQNRYGTFQEVVSLTKEEAHRAQKVAEQLLKEKSNPESSISVQLLGDDKVRAGRVISISNESFDLNGYYLIKNCKQSYKNNNRFMDLDLERVDV